MNAHDFFNTSDNSVLKEILLFDSQNPLLFNSCLFLILFTLFLFVYQAARRYRNAKLIFVIIFSLYFYYKSSAAYCFILLGVCLFDFILGKLMGKTREKSKNGARWLIVLNVAINVGMLVYFKYFNLLYETLANITRTSFDPLDIVLPAGISFFTFRSISYIVDIYRGELEPADNFLEYTFFLTFFPPLLAGPVVRAKDMLPQIKADPVATRAMVSEGIFLIIAGLIKKVILADYISGNFVDRIFENPGLYSGFENLLGAVGFTLQIYCDFSGYSDMAIGIALLLGYRFKDNFRSPFKSENPTEFWRRWHISLSTWLRDYVYIPLGGNRKGKVRTHINQMTTMIVGGVWHGASWMYLVWGVYQGALLVIHKALRTIWPVARYKGEKLNLRPLNIAFTFVLTVIGFVFFRFAIASHNIAESWEGVKLMGSKIFTDFRPQIIPVFVDAYFWIVVAIVFGYVLHFLPERYSREALMKFSSKGLLIQTVILALILFLVIQVRQSDLVPFVYLQY